jgi:alpha-amylase
MGTEFNGVVLQAFHWFITKEDPNLGKKPLWVFLKEEADHLRDIGIDAVWIPPPCKAAGGENDVGYGIHDHFDLGEFDAKGTIGTKYGTKQQLHDAINALHGFKDVGGQLVALPNKPYIQVYVDAVLNHKSGGDQAAYYWDAIRVETSNRTFERWEPGYESGPIKVKGYTRFNHPARNGKYSQFVWRSRHFDSVDTECGILQDGATIHDGRDANGESRYIYRFLYNEEGYIPQRKPGFAEWVSLEKGNYDFLTGADVDYGRYDVREEMKYWGQWLTATIGADGFRLDAVKHFSADFAREWIGHVRARAGKPMFVVGEYLSGNVSELHTYLARVSAYGQFPQSISLLDFPLRFKFKTAGERGRDYDLREWNRGTLLAEQPAAAVTMVESHDDEYGRGFRSHVEEWIKPHAYAFILLRRGGYPVVFFPDYYGSHDEGAHLGQPAGRGYLDLLLKLRKQFALGDERYYDSQSVAGWVRMGGVPGAKGAMAVVINIAADGVGSMRMNTGRSSKRFYHLATIRTHGTRGPDNFEVVRYRYDRYGDKADGLWTDGNGEADFLAEAGTVAIWIEDGVGLI